MRPEFRDANGRAWSIEITAGVLRRVREATGIKLGEILTNRLEFEKIYDDEERFGRVLYELCWIQASGETKEAFLERLGGDAIREGRDAIVEAVANFTQPREISAAFALNWKSRRDEVLSSIGRSLTNELTESSESVSGSAGSPASTLAL